MSDTDYMPSHMDSISETQSGNDSPVFVGTPTTQQQRKSRAKKKQYLHQEKESALHSEQEVHEPKSVENENKKNKNVCKSEDQQLEEYISEYISDIIVIPADEPVAKYLSLN